MNHMEHKEVGTNLEPYWVAGTRRDLTQTYQHWVVGTRHDLT